MYFKREIFLIMGLKKSGISCGKFLLEKGAKCYFYESDQTVAERNFNSVGEMGGILVSEEELENVLNEITVLVLSPGVPIDNPVCIKAKNLGKRITGELELGVEYLRACVVAVTGTNGKTTTSYLINHVLETSGATSYAVGNIGIPVTGIADKCSCQDIAVTEVSSFQLETCNRIMPHIAIVLNITPDHLSRHYTFENYVYVKSKLLRNMRESEYAVLNYDDEIVKQFAQKTRAKVLYFSLNQKVNGAYLQEGWICFNSEKIIEFEKMNIKGEHNVLNALASIVACKILGVSNEVIEKALTDFKGVKHRIEFVTEKQNVSFYNDSKSTNPDSTVKAVNAMDKNTFLLLGGKDKGLDYTQMMKSIKSGKLIGIFTFGEVRYKMYEFAVKAGIKNVYILKNMESAVKAAFDEARACGESVNLLLSPACSSFDEFSGYEERGERYEYIVNEL